MKFFVAFAALVAVVSCAHKPAISAAAELDAIIAAINSPSTDPATASLLEQQLEAILGIANPEPIAVGPAVVDTPTFEPISVGPAIVDFPLPDGGAVSAPVEIPPIVVGPAPVAVGPSPVVVGPIAPGAPSPLVQIILNINQAESAVVPAPAAVATPAEIEPTPVHVVDAAPTPVQVVEAAPTPIQVVEAAPTPIQVIEASPVPVEPVIIGTPIIPVPAITLPEELN